MEKHLMDNYQKLKQYLQTKYDYHANIGRFNLGDREGLESEYKWRLLCDIMEYIDTIEMYHDIDMMFSEEPRLRLVK